MDSIHRFMGSFPIVFFPVSRSGPGMVRDEVRAMFENIWQGLPHPSLLSFLLLLPLGEGWGEGDKETRRPYRHYRNMLDRLYDSRDEIIR
ncbi:MAG TPA: hypothetical protein PLX83_18470, partial [bacterium]|nr:hypothetical protein [bacterium]